MSKNNNDKKQLATTDGNGTNPDGTKPDGTKPDGTGKWTDNFTWKNAQRAGGVLGIAGIITGLVFLPEALTKAIQQSLFGWLPEELQPYASSACCISSCSGICAALALAMFLLLK